MFIFHTLVYLSFAFVMYLFAVKSKSEKDTKHKIDKYLWMYIIFFSIISGIRYGVGVDCVSYIKTFEEGTFREDTNEYLFETLVDFIFSLGLHSSIGLTICAFFQVYPIVKACKDYKYLLVFLPFVLFGGAYYRDMMNAVRQCIACSIFLYASKFIVERKLIKYVILIIIASLFHHSSLYLVVLYLLPTGLKIADKRVLMLCGFFACFIIGNSPQFKQLGQMMSVLEGSEYSHYADRASAILSIGEVDGRNFGLTQFTYLITALFPIMFGKKMEKLYSKKIPYFNLWYMLSYFYGCLYFLFCKTSHLFLRPVMYFELFQMIIVSLLLFMLFRVLKNRNFRYLGFIFSSIIWIGLIWGIIKAESVEGETTIYKIFLFN